MFNDHRDPLYTQLQGYRAATGWEEQCRQSMLALIEQRPDCFQRNCLPGHFTAAVYVTNPAATKVLLMKHKKLGVWLQFGGHADGEHLLRKVALKELEEESGLPAHQFNVGNDIFDMDMHIFPLRRNTRPDDVNLPHIHFDVRFKGALDENIPLPGNDESEAIRWFDLDEAVSFYRGEGNIRPILKLGNRPVDIFNRG